MLFMKGRKKLLFLVFLAISSVVLGALWGGNSFLLSAEQSGSAQIPSAYERIDARAGVWNDGQAALWDLHIIDQFRIFGHTGRARGYKPEQPINFSHVTHVMKHQIDCQYCHWNVAKSSYAAIPEVQTCYGCHQLILGETEEQRHEIQKIREYFDNNEPIPWVKVHPMPDYVSFNHKRHIKAGIACHECHGQVPVMDVVERATSMKMGWCIDCHREKAASIDCYTCHY
jgi:hypothetical protein